MSAKMLNLEPVCARCGHGMIDGKTKIEDQENTLTKALGVLTESGLYAMCVFLLSCSKKEYGKKILTEDLRKLWQEDGISLMDKKVGNDPAAVLKAVRKITEELPCLILARKITTQTLTFARYHAKAGVTS